METQGTLAPETDEELRDAHEGFRRTAETVVRETAKAMGFDGDEYDERVTDDVVETAQDALFASSLEVHVGDRDAYESWREDHPEYEATEVGHPDVDNVAWHPAPVADAVVAATYQDEPEAAVDALRRQAFGRFYRDRL